MYLGHLPSVGSSEPEGFSAAVEASHHDLLDQVLDDDRSLFALEPITHLLFYLYQINVMRIGS